MPLMRCSVDGRPGWKYGKTGHCYGYAPGDEGASKRAKKLAIKQAIAMHGGKAPAEGFAERVRREYFNPHHDSSTGRFTAAGVAASAATIAGAVAVGAGAMVPWNLVWGPLNKPPAMPLHAKIQSAVIKRESLRNQPVVIRSSGGALRVSIVRDKLQLENLSNGRVIRAPLSTIVRGA